MNLTEEKSSVSSCVLFYVKEDRMKNIPTKVLELMNADEAEKVTCINFIICHMPR